MLATVLLVLMKSVSGIRKLAELLQLLFIRSMHQLDKEKKRNSVILMSRKLSEEEVSVKSF